MLSVLKENGMSLLIDSVKEFSSLLGDETNKVLKELGVLFTAQKKQFLDDFKQYQSSLRCMSRDLMMSLWLYLTVLRPISSIYFQILKSSSRKVLPYRKNV